MQHFEIENYRFIEKTNSVLVYIKRDKLAIPITIPKEKFEFWLRTSQRLMTTLVLHEENQETIQADAVMSKEEYWKLNHKEIHSDLYDYIIGNPINYRGTLYERSLVSINYAFEMHKIRRN